jgi:eukaryotic-like serine/threonine-protein kinase
MKPAQVRQPNLAAPKTQTPGTHLQGIFSMNFRLPPKPAARRLPLSARRLRAAVFGRLALFLTGFGLRLAGAPFTNSLGQVFVPLPGHAALVGVWETRVGDFRRFVAATGHDTGTNMYTLGPDDHDWLPRGHTWRDPGFPQTDAHPVVGVNWADARAFCAWLTEHERAHGFLAPNRLYRLPADREWSAAVGLADETGATPEERLMNADEAYPWGATWPPPAGFGNYGGSESAAGKPSWWGTIPGGYADAHPRTAPVGSYPANALGVFDLSGNVWEWCEDAFTTSARGKIIRGGCWGSDRPAYLLAAKRNHAFPGMRNDETGFRVVLAPAP